MEHGQYVKPGNAGHVILVGINYDPKTKEHTCEIERLCV